MSKNARSEDQQCVTISGKCQLQGACVTSPMRQAHSLSSGSMAKLGSLKT